MVKIDEIDRKILTALVNDASMPVSKLSKKIKVNHSVCYSRIQRLIRRNLIKKFNVVVNEEMLGYRITALVGINTDMKQRESILGNIKKLPETRAIHEVTGRFDILLSIKARSLDDLHEVVTGRIGVIEGVVRSETFIAVKTILKDPTFTEHD